MTVLKPTKEEKIMSFILLDFADWVLDENFVAEHCQSTPIEFGNFINREAGLAEEMNGFGFSYNKHEINTLHSVLLENANLPSDGQGNLIPDDKQSYYENDFLGLSPAQRNGRG